MDKETRMQFYNRDVDNSLGTMSQGHPLAEKAQVRQINLIDMAYVIAHYRRSIVRFVTLTLILTVILFWIILPRWYKSTAVIMPPKQKNSLSLLGSFTRAASSLRSLGIGGLPSDDLAEFQTILLSRRVMEDVVRKFDLLTVYDLDSIEKAVKELRSNIEVTRGKEDVSLEIITYDTQPERSAAIANYLVEVLNRVYIELSVAEARSNREFLELRYKQNLADLRKAEEDYRRFQEKFKVFSLPDQMKAAVTAVATVRAQIALKEVELGVLSRSASAENPERERIQYELQELRKQLQAMNDGKPNEKFNFLPPLARTPEIGIEYIRRYRELEIQGKILELLMPLYEQARIEEQRNTPSVIVLDRAVAAEKASKPKRLILTIAITFCSIILAVLFTVYRNRARVLASSLSTEELNKLLFIKQEFHWKRLLR